MNKNLKIFTLTTLVLSILIFQGCNKEQETKAVVAPPVAVADKFPVTYTNDDFGFSLKLPSSWRYYSTQTVDFDWGEEIGKTPLIIFSLNGAELLGIEVLSLEQWKTYNAPGPQALPIYITENDKNVFTWHTTVEIPNELKDERDQIKDFIKTFTLI